MIEIGAAAPDFALKDQDGQEVRLSGLKGKVVLLSFHPLAFTGVCQEQMLNLERNFDKLAAKNAFALGISCDPVPSKKAWADAMGIKKTKILSDFWPHGNVSRNFGIFREADGFSQRANILIDELGKVIFAKQYDIPQPPDMSEVLAAIR